MSGAATALNAAVREAQELLAPLQEALQSEAALRGLLRDYGWDIAPGIADVGAVSDAIGIGADLTAAAIALRDIAAADAAPSLDALGTVVTSLSDAINRVRELGSTPPPQGLGAVWSNFVAELPDGLVADHLRRRHTGLFAVLRFFGVIEEVDVDPAGATNRIGYIRRTLHWNRLGLLVTDPTALVRSRFQWTATAAPDPAQLVSALAQMVDLSILPVGVVPVRATWRDEFFAPANPRRADAQELQVTLLLLDDDAGNRREVRLCMLAVPGSADPAAPTLRGVALGVEHRVTGVAPDSGWWPFGLELSGFEDPDGPVLVLEPGKLTARRVLGAELAERVAARFDSDEPALLLGSFDSHRLELSALTLGLGLQGPPAAPDASLSLHLEGLACVLLFGETDGFLSHVFGDEEQRFELDVEIVWSSTRGLRLNAQAGLRAVIAIDRALGPARLHTITVGAGLSGGEVSTMVALSGSVTLGPIAASVDELGIAARFAQVPEDQPAGVLGGLDVQAGFKPPSGVGLAVNASIVKGGGFVYFDTARGQYAGVLQLEIAKKISLKAIGLISTRLPDGSPGFSLFVLITAEGFSPIQLGLGFTLNGVGGLLGINRAVNIGPLRGGLKTGTLDSVLFPADPVRNAPAILNTLDSVFPARRAHYVLGPMAIIGWGSPTILTLKLAVLLEFPDPTRLILLGRLAALLPDAKDPLVRLQLDAIGVLDFDKGELSLDASLFDSRIAQFVITGDMALRIGWGADPQFLLSVGGFNPRFAAPPGLRPLERLAISLAESDNPRLRLEAYFAITSNTLQFGARFELYAAKAGFSLEGHLGFDALVTFVPFGFVIDISAAVALRFGGQVVLSVAIELTLSGPTPWRAVGSASFTFLLIHASVNFDVQIGEGAPPPAPAPVDVRALLAGALADPSNWASQLPEDAPPLVSLREPDAGGTRVHPLAVLVVRERIVPLNRTITRYGPARPAGERRFALDFTDRDGAALPFETKPVSDAFARSQYEDLRDDEKLTLPSFEPMESGRRLGLDELRFDADSVVDVDERYESRLWDPALDDAVQPIDAGPALVEVLPDPRRVAIPAGLRP